MGSLSSEFDSLSYALGANIAMGMNYEMSDIPFDWKAVDEGLADGALDRPKIDHEEALKSLRDYFMTKRMERSSAIAAKNAADSTRTVVTADPEMFESEKERKELSYALGSDWGFNIKESGLPLQLVWVAKAMQDVRDSNPQMDEMQVNQYLQYYFTVKLPKMNAEASAAWLAKVEKQSGVQKTESGLLYKVTRKGDDTVIAKDPRDTVVVNYRGTTRKEKEFDSSYKRDEPATFPLNRVIPGWTEGLQLVGKGGAITLWIPAELAYGPRAMGRDIQPNEALCFEVEVIDVKPYVEPAPAEEAPAEE